MNTGFRHCLSCLTEWSTDTDNVCWACNQQGREGEIPVSLSMKIARGPEHVPHESRFRGTAKETGGQR